MSRGSPAAGRPARRSRGPHDDHPVIVVEDQPVARARLVSLLGEEPTSGGRDVRTRREAVDRIRELGRIWCSWMCRCPSSTVWGRANDRRRSDAGGRVRDRLRRVCGARIRAARARLPAQTVRPCAAARRPAARAPEPDAPAGIGHGPPVARSAARRADPSRSAACGLRPNWRARPVCVPGRTVIVEASGNYALLHVERVHKVRETVSEMEVAAPAFMRIHRSTLVNVSHIRNCG